jgi:hypothetical protein
MQGAEDKMKVPYADADLYAVDVDVAVLGSVDQGNFWLSRGCGVHGFFRVADFMRK